MLVTSYVKHTTQSNTFFYRHRLFIPWKEIDRTPALQQINKKICFDRDDNPNVEDDIFEIRSSGATGDGVSITVSIDNDGSVTNLLFGEGGTTTKITIDSTWGDIENYCRSGAEAAQAIKFQNGNIIQSQCVDQRGNLPSSII